MKKAIGYISYTHGLDGKVKVLPLVSKSEFEKYISETQIKLDNKTQDVLSIKIFAFTGKSFLCTVEGISKIDETERIIKHEIFVELDDDNCDYINPELLLNFDVFIQGYNEKYGKVVDFGDYGSGDLIKIEKKNKKYEFYFCNKDTIISMDKKNKSIVIKNKL